MKRLGLWGKTGLAALAIIAAIGCFRHEERSSDGQSHWLTACESSAQCGANLDCVCGVCTALCEGTNECRVDPPAACVPVASFGEACAGAGDGARVCLARCERDRDCRSNDLACVDGSCVESMSVAARDAGDMDAATAVLDASADAGGDHATPIDAGGSGTCETAPCDAQVADRPPCQGWQCADGLLCHVDGTCIERGATDEQGIAVLAVASEPYDGPSNLFGIGQFAVADGAIYWFDTGSRDAPGNHRGDGAIYVLALAGGSPVALASELSYGPGALKLQGDRVYYTNADGVWSVPRDGGVDPVRLFEREEINSPPWTVHDGFVYYVDEFHGTNVRRVQSDGTQDEPFFAAAGEVHGLAAIGNDFYVEAVAAGEIDSRLIRVAIATGESTPMVSQFRAEHDQGPLWTIGDLILTEAGDHVVIERHSMTTAERLTVAFTDAWLDLRSAADGFVYYREQAVQDYVARAAVEPAEPQRLRTATGSVGHIVAADGIVYWVEANRLLQRALPNG